MLDYVRRTTEKHGKEVKAKDARCIANAIRVLLLLLFYGRDRRAADHAIKFLENVYRCTSCAL